MGQLSKENIRYFVYRWVNFLGDFTPVKLVAWWVLERVTNKQGERERGSDGFEKNKGV